MPWDEVSVDEAKLRFLRELLSGEWGMAELCARHGISRQTGHKYKRRHAAEGLAGLAERSRAPHGHGRATDPALVAAPEALRRARPRWGPRKLLARLREEGPGLAWPAPSTAAELLRRAGLSEPRRRARRPMPQERPFGAVRAPNDTWCVDFKGWFRTGDGARCDPLTVSDAHSRFLLGLEILEPRTEPVRAAMERPFREYGPPGALRSDNGPPFAGPGAGGLTRLSAWWAKPGIGLGRIEPGRPQQNGRHERLHGTPAAEACRAPAADRARQQARFDAFRDGYNEERPHEALGQVPPGRVYRPSPRPFPARLEEPAYGPDELVRRVRSNGEVKWRNGLLFVSEALAGEPVGIGQVADGFWRVRFADVPLAVIDPAGRLTRLGPGRPPRTQATDQPAPETVSDASGQKRQR
jgi:transposase InsO family protein